MDFNIDSLTLGELEDLDDALTTMGVVTADKPFYQLFEAKLDEAGNSVPKPMPFKVTRAIAWVIARRDDPAVTLEQMRDVKMVDLTRDNVDPTDRTAPKGSKRGARSPSSTGGR